MPETFRVNLFRSPLSTDALQRVGKVSENVGENVGDVGENVGDTAVNVGDIKVSVLKIISDNDKASAADIAKTMSVTQRTVERYIKELREEGKLVRHGSARGGYWEVVK